jgi:hypothetical protein
MSPLRDYLAQVQHAISTFPEIQVEEYWEQLLTVTRANLRIKLHLADNSLLEVSEALAVEGSSLTWLSYRYHWQDTTGHLILRYDNAPHHPEVGTFPHHKHLRETVVAAQRPALPDLFVEIQRHLFKPE